MSEGEGDFLSSETVSTAQESVEYVLRKDHANVELMAASLGVPPLLVFGPFEQLLEKATTASSAKPVPLPHHIGNTVDLQQVRHALATCAILRRIAKFWRACATKALLIGPATIVSIVFWRHEQCDRHSGCGNSC